ncbi:FprA family A-type flavoprotein [Miniphocaeibacter massiliensis]|uniref:FprA family A-type flavoprotein n=1 Tax=Miniphocaeibacter massiliensis TaxID=2041841 RepID=UPI000C1BAB2A|nr:FprA family A-type flavoprotein [Miniphocaeibacter massiliensis]
MNCLYAKILDDLYYIGANDRQTPLFENMWPLPEGVSYNAYLIRDEKTALLDTVRINKVDGFIGKVLEVLEGRTLDYLVIHHMEPDHSGCIRDILELFPDLTFVGNKKTKTMLYDFLEITPDDNKFIEVKDGDTLDLGKRKLNFVMTPMVHWPESMVSYEPTDKVLFSQDIFGGFGTVDGAIFDDQADYNIFRSETRRYYSNIVGKYSMMAVKALDKLSKIDIDIICPVHGFVWRENPQTIIDDYKKWANHEVEDGVVITYGSMYGNTEAMADYLATFLAREGVKNIKVFDVSKTHASYILNEIWKYKCMILGSATYDNSVYPNMYNLLNVLRYNKLKNHIMGVFGSYGWSGGAVKQLTAFMEEGKFEKLETIVESRGTMHKEEENQLRKLAKEIATKLKEN